VFFLLDQQQYVNLFEVFFIDFFVIQVGGLKAGCFKIGHTGGMLDNILMSKLYRSGRYGQGCLHFLVQDIRKHIYLF